MASALMCSWPTIAQSQGLTASDALMLLRESAHSKQLQIRLAAAHSKPQPDTDRPGPSFSASIEGAGRTEFYGIEQRLSFNGEGRASRRAREAAQVAEEAEVRHELRQIEADLLDAFYRLLYAQEKSKATARAIAELVGTLQIVEQLHSARSVSSQDVFLVQYEQAELRVAQSEASLLHFESLARLTHLLGERVDPETAHAVGRLDSRFTLPPLWESLAEALTLRSDLRAAEARLEHARLEADAAGRRRTRGPTFLGGIKRADLGDRFAYGPFVTLTIPLRVPGRERGGERLPSDRELKTREELGIVRNQIRAEVWAAHHSLRIRRQTVEEFRTGLLAEGARHRETVVNSYRSGDVSSTELLSALRVERDAELRMLELRAAAKLAEVEFDRAAARTPR